MNTVRLGLYQITQSLNHHSPITHPPFPITHYPLPNHASTLPISANLAEASSGRLTTHRPLDQPFTTCR
jgi:hypothetical protein